MDRGPVRVMVTEERVWTCRRAHPTRPPRGAHRRLRDGLRYPQSHAGISRFTDMARQAASYRDKRVLLPATRARAFPSRRDKDSTSVSRTP